MASSRNPKPLQNSTDDRISKLPDPILHQILSLLPTKEAARTSVLSKQWQFQWTWLTNLELEQRGIDYTSFEPIALQILRSRRCSSITKFKLYCRFDSNHHDWDWISPRPILLEAVSRNVEELDFTIYHGSEIDSIPKFNLSIFSAETLVILKLKGEFLLMLDDSNVRLPSLKVLSLCYVLYEDHDSVGKLLSGCPVLEDLYMEKGERTLGDDYDSDNDDYDYDKDYRVSSLTLRNFVLEEDTYTPYGSQMTYVDAPALESMTVHVSIRYSAPTIGLRLKNLDNLERAVIGVTNREDQTAGIDWGEFMGVFQGLYAVSYLEFTCDTPCKESEYYIASSLKFPRFDSLVELKLKGYCCFWPMLFHILHACPVLQNLTYEKYEHDEYPCDDGLSWMPPQRVPDCLPSHLTTFKFLGFGGSEFEFGLIQYVMKNSKVLRNMTITDEYSPDFRTTREVSVEQQLDALEEFFRSERGSERCILYVK